MAARLSQWPLEVSTTQYSGRWKGMMWACCWMPQQHSLLQYLLSASLPGYSNAQHWLTEPECGTGWWGTPPCLSLLRDGHDTAVDDLSHALPCCIWSVPFLPISWCSVCHSLSPACQRLLSTLLICSTLHAETNALNQGPVWQHQAPFITSALHQKCLSVYQRINCCC